MTERAPIVLAITGASGAPYAVRLLEALVRAEERVWLMISSHGWRLLQMESGIGSVQELRERTEPNGWDAFITLFDAEDRGAAPASGSARTRGMIICPCSMGTVAAIASGTSRSLVERAADVTLKERRQLILVTRETPLSVIHLENMLRLTRAGAVVLPASPGFYNSPRGIPDLIDFVVARVLDHAGVEHSLGKRWGAEPDGEG
ncbi:MAG: UbiX family flavin prenyltransferase [Gemmatimonadaceae bacterium]|nr:UbiX family flavin prenyltransferase [Gemmatimonadaceae bacterium]